MTFWPDDEIGVTSKAEHIERGRTPKMRLVSRIPRSSRGDGLLSPAKQSSGLAKPIVRQCARRSVHACTRQRGAAVLRRGGRQAGPGRPGHAGKADIAAASWWPWLRPLDLQARLFRLG